MTKATVHAVMRVTIEIPVRQSASAETLQEMHDASKREAEGALRNRLPPDFRVVGPVEFSHALVKANP